MNLCAISAALYGDPYASAGPGGCHIDPSITEAALCLALAQYDQTNPGGLEEKQVKLFYYEGSSPSLIERAWEVKQILI